MDLLPREHPEFQPEQEWGRFDLSEGRYISHLFFISVFI